MEGSPWAVPGVSMVMSVFTANSAASSPSLTLTLRGSQCPESLGFSPGQSRTAQCAAGTDLQQGDLDLALYPHIGPSPARPTYYPGVVDNRGYIGSFPNIQMRKFRSREAKKVFQGAEGLSSYCPLVLNSHSALCSHKN